jgi:hypothetical protein
MAVGIFFASGLSVMLFFTFNASQLPDEEYNNLLLGVLFFCVGVVGIFVMLGAFISSVILMRKDSCDENEKCGCGTHGDIRSV